MNTQHDVKDLSAQKNSKKIESIDFLDVEVQNNYYKNELKDLSAEDLRDLLVNIKSSAEGGDNYGNWKRMVQKINGSYFNGIPPELSAIMAGEYNTDLDVILTNGATNKVREMVRVITNMLMKNRPRFEPDPSGASEDTKEEDLIIATRFLEHAWDRGGLTRAAGSVVKKALRANRGIMKTYWSHENKDIMFKSIDPLNFWFDFSKHPKDSFFYVEEYEIPYYKLELSGVFTGKQLDDIRHEMGISPKGNSKDKKMGRDKDTDNYNKKIIAHDYYIKIKNEEDKNKVDWMLVTFINNNVLIRKTIMEHDDVPYSFFITEMEDNAINLPHSMNDVCNASAVANYLNFKILNWIQNLTDITVVVDEQVEVDRTSTPGVRQITVSSTDGVTSMSPIVPTAPTINQDVFFHLERLQRNAENNFGVHPNILQGVNGSTPSNGIVAETLLSNDIHNTSMISQEFQDFLKDVAYKILHIAYYKYEEHRVIRIGSIRGSSLDDMKVIGGNSVSSQEGGDELMDESNIGVIKKFPNINVTIKPGSAYTEKAKAMQILSLLNVSPEMIKYIPKSMLLEAFAEGSANLMMHQAAREASEEQLEEMNYEVKLAEAENQSMSAGQQRVAQPNENHQVHDRIHLIEEMFVLDQMRKSNDQNEQQSFASKLNMIRAHREQHKQLAGQQMQQEASQTRPSPSLIGTEEPGAPEEAFDLIGSEVSNEEAGAASAGA